MRNIIYCSREIFFVQNILEFEREISFQSFKVFDEAKENKTHYLRRRSTTPGHRRSGVVHLVRHLAEVC